ncbi:MAG: NADH:ubiquinone oxidoreductase [Candidatus Woesearchaeota archaeon]
MKPVVGFFSFTGCSGCTLEVIHQEGIFLDLMDKMKIVHFPLVQGKNALCDLDIAVVEGSISTKEQQEKLLLIRQKSKFLIALGACSGIGGVNAIRNTLNEKQVEKLVYSGKNKWKSTRLEPIGKFVPVDYYVRGCPPVKEDFDCALKQLLLRSKPFVYNQPVCSECRIKENPCLLSQGRLCLGPITFGGCDAICPSNKLPCDGCRGKTEDANFNALKQVLEDNGFSKQDIKKLASLFNSNVDFSTKVEVVKPK